MSPHAKLGRSAGWTEELDVMKGLWLGFWEAGAEESLLPRTHQLPGPGGILLVQRTHTIHTNSEGESREGRYDRFCIPRGSDVLMRAELNMYPHTTLHELRSGNLHPPLHGPRTAFSFENINTRLQEMCFEHVIVHHPCLLTRHHAKDQRPCGDIFFS